MPETNFNDAAVETFKSKLAVSYGGVNATPDTVGLPWDIILAALMGLLDQCFVSGPDDLKRQARRPLMQARMRLQMYKQGLSLRVRDRAVAATLAAVEASSNEEIAGYLAAAQELD